MSETETAKVKRIRCLDSERTAKAGVNRYCTHTIRLYDEAGNRRPDSEVNAEISLIRAQNRTKNREYRAGLVSELARSMMPLVAPETPIPLKTPEVVAVTVGSSRKPKKLWMHLTPDTGNTSLFLGSSKAGKSTLMLKLYKKYYTAGPANGYISTLLCASPQADVYKGLNGSKKKWYNHPIIVEDPSDVFCEIIDEQHAINKKSKNKFRFLNMIDDIIDLNTRNHNSACLDRLMLTLRNSEISSMISLQYSNLISKCSRANVNNIYLFRFNNDEAIEIIIRCYLQSMLPEALDSMSKKIAWYRSVTMNHGYIHVVPELNEFYIRESSD